MEPVWHRPEPDDLYVHLAADGGIFVAPGEDLTRSAWITSGELRRRVAEVPRTGRIWLSEPDPSPLTRAPAEAVMAADTTIAEALPLPETQRPLANTALMSAAYVGAADLVEDLLSRGVPVDARNDNGYTALLLAAEAGETTVAERLLQAGADIEATDHDGTTALMLAAWSGRAATVARLRALGADPTRTRPTPGDPTGAPIDARGLALGRNHAEAAAACGPGPPEPPAGGPPSPPAADRLRFVPPRIRWPWVVLGLMTLFIAAAVAASRDPRPADVVIGLAMVAFVASVITFVVWRRNRAGLEFDGWRLTLRPPLGRTRTFDLGDVARVRRRPTQMGLRYAIRLRNEDGTLGRRLYIPVDMFGRHHAGPELLRRLAAVPGIDADRQTAEELDAWRARGVGTQPGGR